MAREPNPANGATGVLMPGITMLSWTKGATARFHDLYFGTDPNPPKSAVRHRPRSFIWFRWLRARPTIGGSMKSSPTARSTRARSGVSWLLRYPPSAPCRATATSGSIRTAIWSGSPEPMLRSHDVYFSTDKNAVAGRDASVIEGDKLPIPQFDLPTLEAGTTYYWLVDEYDTSDVKHEGEVWSFTINDPRRRRQGGVLPQHGCLGRSIPDPDRDRNQP